MENEIKKYLFDIKESIDSIESFLGTISDGTHYFGNSAICVDPSTTPFTDSLTVADANKTIKAL